MLIRFVELNELTTTREGGREAKRNFIPVIRAASASNPIIFDFVGVTSISSSFADEFFGKLINDMGFTDFKAVTTFRNMNPFVSNVIRNSIFHRNSELIGTT